MYLKASQHFSCMISTITRSVETIPCTDTFAILMMDCSGDSDRIPLSPGIWTLASAIFDASIAASTATAIEYVREKYPNIIFVGSQPALKPACQKYGEENVLLLATPTTIRESQFLHSYPNVATLSIDGLPTLIDENLFELENLIPLLQESLLPYSPKAIVLGCTHFEALKEVLSFKNAELFSSSEGIAKRLSEFCSQQGGNDVNFMTTGSGESLAKFYSYFLKLISQNVQNLN